MEKKYYIKLIGKDLNRKWYYSDLEKRNELYEKVRERFDKDRSNQLPFIEIDIGIEEPGETVTFPIRLSPDMKDEVIKYIDSLN